MITKKQYKFLKILYKHTDSDKMTAPKICQLLNIKKTSSYYSSIMSYIDAFSEVATDFDDTYDIFGENTGYPDKDVIFCITAKGKTIVESKKSEYSKWLIGIIVAIVGILVTIIIA